MGKHDTRSSSRVNKAGHLSTPRAAATRAARGTSTVKSRMTGVRGGVTRVHVESSDDEIAVSFAYPVRILRFLIRL